MTSAEYIKQEIARQRWVPWYLEPAIYTPEQGGGQYTVTTEDGEHECVVHVMSETEALAIATAHNAHLNEGVPNPP